MEYLEFLKYKAIKAVIFTQHNLQLELDDATITCFRLPLLLGASQDVAPSQPDYSNGLVQLINQPIVMISEVERGLIIGFESAELLFPTDGQQEILIVTDDNDEWYSYPNPFEAE